MFLGTYVFLQVELSVYAMRDTPFVPSVTEWVLWPVLTGGLEQFLWFASIWASLDLENPDNDIATIEGVPGAVLSIVGIFLAFGGKVAPVELWRLYRSRNLKLPPNDALSWWQTTRLAGRGIFAAALVLWARGDGLCPPLPRNSNVL